VNAICVAPTVDGWYRAQVVAVDTETDSCDIKFVDYGGYLTLSSSALRQIRGDFMTLPFQAAECYLANVGPVGGTCWILILLTLERISIIGFTVWLLSLPV
jgi:A-kinase anchor protein 1